MGLIKAFAGAVGGTMADQWKEFFYCDALSENVLVAKGQKRTSRRSSNTKGEENIISNGSGIAVNEGQCMIIVSQGEVVEFCAEAGDNLVLRIECDNKAEEISEKIKSKFEKYNVTIQTDDEEVYYSLTLPEGGAV